MSTLEHLTRLQNLCDELKAQGCEASISVSVNIPLPVAVFEEAEAARKPVATMKTVMWALNQLKAAPGQDNRELVRKFLFMRGWLEGAQEPELWQRVHVPVKKSELAQLWGEIRQFEKAQHESAHI